MKKFFVIGNPIQHSKSPTVHNYWFGKYNINSDYDKIQTDEKGLSKIVHQIKLDEIHGVNITVPFKQIIIPYLDELSDQAKLSNSVNTVFKRAGKIIGDNTDIFGFRQSLEEVTLNKPLKSALLIGSGGVAPSIIVALKEMGMEQIYLTNRTEEKAIALQKKFTSLVKVVSWSDLKINLMVDIIINATSLGLPGSSNLEIPFDKLNQNTFVYDVIYNPLETTFLKKAKEKNCIVINGLKMFLYQAQKAFEILTGIKPEINQELIKKLEL